MARFYSVNFNSSLYLTETGAVGGNPCKLDVAGLEDLLNSVVGRAEIAADGTPIFQTFPWTKGKNFEIRIAVLLEAVWTDVFELITESLSENESITINGAGDIGNFSVSAVPQPQKPFIVERFRNGRLFNITLRFITV